MFCEIIIDLINREFLLVDSDLNMKLDMLSPGESLGRDHKFASGSQMDCFFSAVPEALFNAEDYEK